MPSQLRVEMESDTLQLSAARRDELIDRIAARIGAWNLREPAILFLGMNAPLSFLGSQLLLLVEPFVGAFVNGGVLRDVAFLMEEPANIERLIERLEEPARQQNSKRRVNLED